MIECRRMAWVFRRQCHISTAAEEAVDFDDGIDALRVVKMQRVFAVFCDAFGVVKLFFERANNDAVMVIYYQAAHFPQCFVKAVIVKHIALVFQHGEFRVTLGYFCDEIAPSQAQVFFRHPGVLVFVVIEFTLAELLHFFYQGSGFSIHRLHCLDVDFFAQAVVV